METNRILEQYKKVASFLDDSESTKLIDLMQQRIESHQYFLPFIGQYNAGKSKLINRLIGRDILPTKGVETTAFLTYIEYSNSDYARVDYQDGDSEFLDSIEKVKELDNAYVQKTRPISELHIGLPLPILSNGLIIIDTPGINTLVKEHVQMTEKLLSNAQFIVYVLGTSPSQFDMEMLTNIDGLNIPVIIARTHIDYINCQEEDPLKVIENEEKLLLEKLGHEVDYYPLCNDSSSNAFLIWEENFITFNEYLQEGLAKNASTLYENSVLQRLKLIHEDFSMKLQTRKDSLTQLAQKTDEELDKQLKAIQTAEKELNRANENRLKKIAKEAETLTESIKHQLQSLCHRAVDQFKKSLDEEQHEVKPIVEHFFNSVLLEKIDNMGDAASEAIAKWVGNQVEISKEDLESVKVNLNEVDVVFSADFSTDIIQSYVAKQEALSQDYQERLGQLQQIMDDNESILIEMGVDKEQLEKLISQYNQLNDEYKADLCDYNNEHVPTYIEKKSKLAPVMKGVGTVLDLAMLLIPGPTWASAGGKMAAKGGQMIAKGGKLSKMGGSALKTLSKGAKAMSEVDKMLDATKLVGGAAEVVGGGKAVVKTAKGAKKATGLVGYAQGVAKKASFFDYLSLSYWMEQVGEKIDPPCMVVDSDEEQKFMEGKNQRTRVIEETVRKRIEQEVKLGRLTTETQKLKRKQELEAQKFAALEKEMAEEHKKLEEKAAQEANRIYCSTALKQYETRLNEYVQIVQKRSVETVANLTECIVNAANEYAMSQLKPLSEQIESITSKRTEGNLNVEQEKSQIDHLLSLLNFE